MSKVPVSRASREYQLLATTSKLLASNSTSLAYLERKSGLSTTTLRRIKRWNSEPHAYRPQLKTIEFTLRVLGKKLTITDI